MTVSTEVSHNEYTGNGVTTTFPYTFRVLKKNDLVVQTLDMNDNITTLVMDTSYTVTGVGSYSGGSIILTAPLANGWRITIDRELDVVQETDLRNQGKFFAEVHENAFDYLTMLIQQCFGWLRLALLKPNFLAKYYDAKQNRIVNLSDPFLDQDGVNLRTTIRLDNDVRRYAEELVAGVSPGGGTGSFRQFGSGAILRTFQDKMRETLSAQDFGALGDGISDDTLAFHNMEREFYGRIVDLGGHSYVVTSPFYKNQYINGDLVIDGSKHPVEFAASSLKLKKHCGSFFTGDPNISGQTAIFPGAEGTFQGICAVTTPAGVKLYVTQRSSVADPSEPSYGNFLKGETYRIVEYSLKEDGSEMLATAFSQPLNTIGHASMLSARMEGTQLYFYSGAPNQSATDTTLGGKGFTRIRWNGSTTANSDVTYYELFDQPSVANGIYKNLSKGSVVLSADGATLAIVADDDLQGGYTALLYSLDAVLTSGTPKNVTPLSEFNFPMYRGYTLQGVTLTADSLIIYYAAPDNSAAMREFDFNGNQRAMIDNIQLIKSLYTEAQYKSGVALVLEPEGSFTIAGDLYVGIREIWNAVGTVVSYNGKFYSPRAATTGNSPASSAYWWEVNDNGASTPYSATTAYTVTGVRTKNKKHIFKLGSLVEAGATPLQWTPQLRSGPKLSNPNLDYAPDGNFGWRRWVDNLKSWLYTLHVSDTGNFRFYDTSTDSLGGAAMMIGLFDRNVGGVRSHFARIRGGESTGGNLLLFAQDDSTFPGAVVEYVGPDNRLSRSTNQYGETYIKANTTGKIPLQVEALGTGDIIRGLRYTTPYFGVRASTVSTFVGSRNGNSLILGAETTDDVSTSVNPMRVQVSLADMAFRPDVNNNANLGTASYLWKTIYASTGSINTSDIRYKTGTVELNDAEMRVAMACAPLICRYKMLSDVEEKGEAARYHIGIIAQRVKAAFEKEGLDGFRYGILCYDEWDNRYEPVMGLRDEETEVLADPENPGGEMKTVTTQVEYDTGEKKLVLTAGSRYAIRYDELAMFIIAGQNYRIDSFESRLAKLERSSGI